MLDLDWIWKLQCPERVLFFLCILCQNKLNTNEIRRRKGMTSDPSCTACHDHLESVEHILRRSPYALLSCRKLGRLVKPRDLFHCPFEVWLRSNLIRKQPLIDGIRCGSVFLSMLRSLGGFDGSLPRKVSCS